MADNLTTWQKWSSRLAIPSIIAGVIFSLYTAFKNEQIHRENAEIRRENAEIRRENAEIKHGQDVKYAVIITGLRVAASKLETGYKTMQKREAQYILINKERPCSSLPSELAVAEPPIEYVPPEAIFMQMGQEHDN